MREVTMYECGICQEIYNEPKYALECERMGKEKALAKVGDLVEYKVEGNIPNFFVELRIKTIEDRGHCVEYLFEQYDRDRKDWIDFSYNVYGNIDFKYLVTKLNKK
ncbi:hypothetical protein ACU3L3_07130 [Priestia endophytica]